MRAVVAGDALLSPRVTRRLIEEFASRAKEPGPSPQLDAAHRPRARGRRARRRGPVNDEIAERLVMSPATAKTHVSRAMVKLGARDRAQLVVFAYESGLVRPAGRLTARVPRGRSATIARWADVADGVSPDHGLMAASAPFRHRTHQAIRRPHCRRPARHRPSVRRRRRLRRPERRRKDDHDGDAPRAGSSDRRHGEVLGSPLNDPAAYLPRVGALIESPAFYPSLSGAENLRMFADVGGLDPRSIPESARPRRPGRRARRSLPHLLTRHEATPRDRGRAARRPRSAILDEPANGLDPQGVRDIRALVGTLAGTGRTVLVSSHDLSELEQICDWLVLIDGGRSLYQGPDRRVARRRGRGPRRHPRAHRGSRRVAARARCDGHRFDLDDERIVLAVNGDDAARLAASVNRAAFAAGIVLVELNPLRTTLEDRYLAMAEGGSR